MPDFSKGSSYNKNANFQAVRFGADAPLLETELNELQEILSSKSSEFIKATYGDGIFGKGTLSYSSTTSTLTYANDKAIVNGKLIDISTLTIQANEGESIYLDTWEEVVSYNDTLKKYGNQQETNTVTNGIADSRLGLETSKRVQLKYNLSKTNSTANHYYIKLGTITNGELVITANYVLTSIIKSGLEADMPNARGSGDLYITSDTYQIYRDFAKDDWRAVGGVKPIISSEEPTRNLVEGLIWYNPNSKEKKIYLDNQFQSIGGGALTVYINPVTVSSDTNTITIGVPAFNQYRDYIDVLQNTTTLTKGINFTVSTDGLSVVKSEGVWKAGTTLVIRVFGTADTAPDILGTVCLVSSYTATTDGITNVPINNPNYNPNTDTLLPYFLGNVTDGEARSIKLFEPEHFSKNANGTSIDLSNWSLTNGQVIKFEVWKKIRMASNTTDGSLLEDKSVTKTKLEQSVQDTLNSVANKIDTSTFTSTTNTINASLADLTNLASLSNDGWFKDKKTGLILQWGWRSLDLAPNGSWTDGVINFPIPFPTACVGVFPAIIGNTGETNVSAIPNNTASFMLVSYNKVETTNTASVRWLALGY